METRWSFWTALVLALSVHLCDEAKAQGITTYLESSGSRQKPRSNAGLAVQGERVRMQADFALRGKQLPPPSHALQRRPSGSTEVVPNLRSAIKLAKNLDIETRVNFAEWNADSATTVDTRLRYRKSLDAFFDELDSSVWRSPDGLTRESVRLGFDQNLGPGQLFPLTISGAAIFEATQGAAAAAADSHTVGLETKVAGFTSPFLAADHTVSFRVQKTEGTRPASSSSLTLDQLWTLSPLTKLGVNLQFLRETYSPADDFEPSIDFSWHSQF